MPDLLFRRKAVTSRKITIRIMIAAEAIMNGTNQAGFSKVGWVRSMSGNGVAIISGSAPGTNVVTITG